MGKNLDWAKDIFNRVNKDNMHLVSEFYDQDAIFQDPIHQIKGVKVIEEYYRGLYKNVDSIRFEYKNLSESEDLVTMEWILHLRVPVLNGGKPMTLDGVSLLKFGGSQGKVIFHRDYFDMGEFIYEKIPVLNSILKLIKNKMRG